MVDKENSARGNGHPSCLYSMEDLWEAKLPKMIGPVMRF